MTIAATYIEGTPGDISSLFFNLHTLPADFPKAARKRLVATGLFDEQQPIKAKVNKDNSLLLPGGKTLLPLVLLDLGLETGESVLVYSGNLVAVVKDGKSEAEVWTAHTL